MYIHTYTQVHTYIRTYIYMYMYIHTYTYPSIHTYIHTYRHTYIHTYIDSQNGIPVSRDTGKDAQTCIPLSRVHRVKAKGQFHESRDMNSKNKKLKIVLEYIFFILFNISSLLFKRIFSIF